MPKFYEVFREKSLYSDAWLQIVQNLAAYKIPSPELTSRFLALVIRTFFPSGRVISVKIALKGFFWRLLRRLGITRTVFDFGRFEVTVRELIWNKLGGWNATLIELGLSPQRDFLNFQFYKWGALNPKFRLPLTDLLFEITTVFFVDKNKV